MPRHEPTLYDFFDAETDESVLVAHTIDDARFVLGDDFATTTRSLAAGYYSEMPAEAKTKRVRNRAEDTRVIEAINQRLGY